MRSIAVTPVLRPTFLGLLLDKIKLVKRNRVVCIKKTFNPVNYSRGDVRKVIVLGGVHQKVEDPPSGSCGQATTFY